MQTSVCITCMGNIICASSDMRVYIQAKYDALPIIIQHRLSGLLFNFHFNTLSQACVSHMTLTLTLNDNTYNYRLTSLEQANIT